MHDSIIEGYDVNLQMKSITMRFRGAEKSYVLEATGVLTHRFENVLQDNIVLSMEEMEISDFLTADRPFLTNNFILGLTGKDYEVQDFAAFLLEKQYKCISLYASWGLHGWILARDYAINEYDA